MLYANVMEYINVGMGTQTQARPACSLPTETNARGKIHSAEENEAIENGSATAKPGVTDRLNLMW